MTYRREEKVITSLRFLRGSDTSQRRIQNLFKTELFVKIVKYTLRSDTIFGNWKPFKNDEKCFLFYSFCSQDI